MRYLFGFLLLLTALVWLVVLKLPDNNLHLITCDVGQGDAILAVYKNYQILTDGGTPDKKVIDCLGRHVPFWDREIEVVVNTHPQLDHFGGLTEVFKRYKVDYFIANGLDAVTNEYGVLRKVVGSNGSRVINPVSGTVIRLGLMSYDIFWPSEPFLILEGALLGENKLSTYSSKRDANDFSIQARISFGNFGGLLTGDIGVNMADQVYPFLPNAPVQYIKVPHHGSKYGLTQNYLKWFVPKIAGISVGKNNTYGHPTKEILDLLNEYKVQTFRTDFDKDIEVVTDGKSFWTKKSGSRFSF